MAECIQSAAESNSLFNKDYSCDNYHIVLGWRHFIKLRHGHPICSRFFRHRVVRVSQQTGQEQTAADHQDQGTNHWCQPASLHPGPVHPQTGENEQVASLWTPHILDTISFSFSPQGGATHLWTLHQLDMRTVSSHRPPLCSTLYQTVSRSTYTYKYKKCHPQFTIKVNTTRIYIHIYHTATSTDFLITCTLFVCLLSIFSKPYAKPESNSHCVCTYFINKGISNSNSNPNYCPLLY